MIQELTTEQFPIIEKLFTSDYPNLPLIQAVVQHKIPGKIWVNSTQSPNACLVATNAPYCFAAGEINVDNLPGFVAALHAKKVIKLACPQSQSLEEVFSELNFKAVDRIQYKQTDFNKLRALSSFQMPRSYIIKKITKELFELCNWKDLMISIYGSADNYIKYGHGFCILDNETVASEAHGIVGDNLVELGTITHSDYRKQGLSALVCAYLAQYCASKNLTSIWTCDAENHGSSAVARKIGLDEDRKYIFWSLGAS